MIPRRVCWCFPISVYCLSVVEVATCHSKAALEMVGGCTGLMPDLHAFIYRVGPSRRVYIQSMVLTLIQYASIFSAANFALNIILGKITEIKKLKFRKTTDFDQVLRPLFFRLE